MAAWTKETALEELTRLIEAADALQASYRKSSEHTRWLIRTTRFVVEVFGGASVYSRTLLELSWQPSGSFIAPYSQIEAALETRRQQAYLEDLEAAVGILLAASDELAESSIEEVYHGKHTAPEASDLVRDLSIIEHRLRKVIRARPDVERDVQDALETLLIGAGLDYSRETEAIEYSSKTYTPDFTLPRLDLAIEVKLCSRQEREKAVIPEINDDMLAYRARYGNVFFVVYDLGFVRDIERFVGQFEETEGVLVRVIKH